MQDYLSKRRAIVAIKSIIIVSTVIYLSYYSTSSNLVIVVAIVIERGKDTLDGIFESRNLLRQVATHN